MGGGHRAGSADHRQRGARPDPLQLVELAGHQRADAAWLCDGFRHDADDVGGDGARAAPLHVARVEHHQHIPARVVVRRHRHPGDRPRCAVRTGRQTGDVRAAAQRRRRRGHHAAQARSLRSAVLQLPAAGSGRVVGTAERGGAPCRAPAAPPSTPFNHAYAGGVFSDAFDRTFVLIAILSALGIIPAFFLKRPERGVSDAAATELAAVAKGDRSPFGQPPSAVSAPAT